MTDIDIVGGVYRERCAFPYWDELFGSAGRAAMALTDSGVMLRLHTTLSKREEITASAIFPSAGVELTASKREHPITFEYLHCLSVPNIDPAGDVVPVQLPEVSGEVVIKFGMLEADPKVIANYCVYDPQSAFTPKAFSASGSQAQHLAIVANKRELLRLSNQTDIDLAVRHVIQSEKAEVVIVKDGLNGASIHHEATTHHVSAYKTKNVFTIGSGDVFVAAFALAWAVKGKSPLEAAQYASLATAAYVETRTLPIIGLDEAARAHREPVKLAGGRIYLAGPFREAGQRMIVDDALRHLSELGMSVFSPIHDIGPGSAEAVVVKDLDAIRQCDAVFAILNGSSPGTVFEVGFARALDKPVFCLAQNMREVDLKLPRGSGAFLHEDYVSALFQIAWRQ